MQGCYSLGGQRCVRHDRRRAGATAVLELGSVANQAVGNIPTTTAAATAAAAQTNMPHLATLRAGDAIGGRLLRAVTRRHFSISATATGLAGPADGATVAGRTCAVSSISCRTMGSLPAGSVWSDPGPGAQGLSLSDYAELLVRDLISSQ